MDDDTLDMDMSSDDTGMDDDAMTDDMDLGDDGMDGPEEE